MFIDPRRGSEMQELAGSKLDDNIYRCYQSIG